jgi:CheY-like chemotaxis protein
MKRGDLRVVIIDDNADATQTLAMLLAANGYQVVGKICISALALDCIRRERPHVAILDIAMPQVDGYELAREIRAVADWPIKLIALTGLGRPCDKADARRAGFDAHLTKPAKWPDLGGVLETLGRGESVASDWLFR